MILGKRHQARTTGLWYVFEKFTKFIYVIILPYILVEKHKRSPAPWSIGTFVHKLTSPFHSSAGFVLRPLKLSSDAVMLVSYPGELFMRLLKLLVLPLIIASITAGKSEGHQ